MHIGAFLTSQGMQCSSIEISYMKRTVTAYVKNRTEPINTVCGQNA